MKKITKFTALVAVLSLTLVLAGCQNPASDETPKEEPKVTQQAPTPAPAPAPAPAPNSFTVTFNTNGGTTVASQTVTEGNKAVRPESNPTKESTVSTSFSFENWFTSTDGGTTLSETAFDFNTPITANTVLYAKWASNSITHIVNFNSNGGSEVVSQTVTGGSRASAPATPSRDGYAFIGWCSDDTLKNRFDFSTSITGPTTLHALWWNKSGFVLVNGATINGAVANSEVFITGRTISIRNLYVCEHEVTQSEYATYCKYGNSSKIPTTESGMGEDYPAFYVNWYDAIVYCNLRSMAEGLTPVYSIGNSTNPSSWNDIVIDNGKYCGPGTLKGVWNELRFNRDANGYRLPTEAEWEYIARGGNNGIPETQTDYSGNDDIGLVAWYSVNSENKVHQTKSKTANTLFIYDMSGNVYEWCFDYKNTISSNTPDIGPNGNNRITRGGSRSYAAEYCRVYDRQTSENPSSRFADLGFRVVRNAN